MTINYVSVKVGKSGTKVHAGILVDTVKKGRFEYPVYRHICGSGNSSHLHNFRVAGVKKTNGIINCEKCLGMMNQ